MDQVIVIPTLNPNARLIGLIDGLLRVGFHRFVIVDDGSDSLHAPLFVHAQARGCHVLHHEQNRGKGVALKTGLKAASQLYPLAPAFITVDDDGQHRPDDVLSVARASQAQRNALVLGERDLKGDGVPLRSRLGNSFSSMYFRFDTGVACADTQTGLRAIPRSMLAFALDVPGDRYEYEMKLLTRAVKAGRQISSVPISTVYVDDNRESHFNIVADSCRIYRSLLCFASASITCAVADLGLFYAFTTMLVLETTLSVIVATCAARIISGFLNFSLNRHWSFKAKGSASPQMLRYAILFIAQMAASGACVALLSFLPIPLVIVKAFVDSGLFVVSYFVQRNWVFKKTSGPKRMERIRHGQAYGVSGKGQSDNATPIAGMQQSEQGRKGASRRAVGLSLRGSAGDVCGIRADGHIRYRESPKHGLRGYCRAGGVRNGGFKS